MASHDYYSYPEPRHDDTSYHSRFDAPLPPVPSSPLSRPHKPTIHTSNISPVTSPFEDHAYPSYPQPSSPNVSQQRLTDPESPNYYGRPSGAASSQSHHDPFTDGNAIPMQNQSKQSLNKTGAVYTSTSPTDAEMGHQSRSGRRRPGGRSRTQKKKQGLFTGRVTWAVFVLTGVQLVMFIVEIVRNAQLTGSPIETKPNFNPMIGPSPYVLINIGARYVPCMRNINVTLSTGDIVTVSDPLVSLQCPNTTANIAECALAELCGSGMNLDKQANGTIPTPDQWWRFIVPIFLHGGIIHIGFNMLLQWTLGRDIEQQIGTLRFLLVYFSSGIFGYVMGGNFAPDGLPSTGCSGSLFGIIAIVLLDLLYTWKNRRSPVRDLCFILLDIVISFILGLLPALDNFSHIGGFLMGLVLGICLLHSPDALRERTGQDDPPYATMSGARRDTSSPGASPMGRASPPDFKLEHSANGLQHFAKQPVGFFKGRKPLWWVWWIFRAGALVGALIAFILLLRNFYIFEKKCKWCKYLSCLPVKNWCDIGNLSFTSTSSKSKRMVKMSLDALTL